MSLSIYYPTTECGFEDQAHYCDDCELSEGARVRSAFFIDEDYDFIDPTNAAEWTAAIAAGDVIVIAKTNGSYDGGGTINYGPGFGDELQTYINSEYKVTFRDRNLKNNYGFYEAMKRQTKWKFGFRTSSLVWISDVVASIAPKNPVADDPKTNVVWEVDVTWISQNGPEPFDMPQNIFECFMTQ